MFERLTSVIAVGVLLLASSAGAADIPCHGCNYSQMMSRALSQGRGEHRIYNYTAGVIYQFSVTCAGNVVQGEAQGGSALSDNAPETQAAGSCPFNRPLQVEEVALDGTMASAWPVIMAFIQTANWQNGSYDYTIDTRRPGINYVNDSSVYKSLSDYPARTRLFSDIYSSYAPLEKFLQAVTAATRAYFTALPNQLLIRFIFKDGTSILIKYDASTTQIEFVRNSARQQNGDPVVEGASAEYQGTYNMAGVDQQAYLNYLGSMGVSIVNGGLMGHLSCSWDGAKLTCKIPKMNN